MKMASKPAKVQMDRSNKQNSSCAFSADNIQDTPHRTQELDAG